MMLRKSVIEPEDSNTGVRVEGYWSETAPVDEMTGTAIKVNGRVTLVINGETKHAVYRGPREKGFSGLTHYMLVVGEEEVKFEDAAVMAA